ncbi:MAG: nucleotide sugar dehydrogenase [Elusimicrobia bacterium]|nr:nucleotide sugar dehydrogenase [Elusimicrobiota bacterium]
MRIAVVGLGYVGLPLACSFAEKKIKVVGIDSSPRKIRALLRGRSYVEDIKSRTVSKVVSGGWLEPTTSYGKISKCECVIVCVPTPLRKSQDPDISYILSSSREIAKYLKKGTTVILESTTYPGTTAEVVAPILEKRGKSGGKSVYKAGRDFYLAFSPERIDPGNPVWHLENTPKVIGGINKKSLEKAVFYYGKIIDKVVPASSLEAAETVKLLENTFRAVNIAMINEMAQIADRLGLDIWEIVRLAATKPYGFMPFYPGPGLGGHCIPIDPLYLSWKMKSLNFYTRFIDLASQINNTMPNFAVSKLVRILNGRKVPVKGSKLLIIGIAYKKDVSDTRESPAVSILLQLAEMGAGIMWFDDLVGEEKLPGKRIRKLTKKVLGSCDAAVIAADHSHLDYEFIVCNSKIVYDLRNATKGIKSKKIYKI